jgi:hypothetical protein
MDMLRIHTLTPAALLLVPLLAMAEPTADLNAVEVLGSVGLAQAQENSCIAVWVPVADDLAMGGMKWYNNDGLTAFPEVLVQSGTADYPVALADAATVATNVTGPSGAWGEVTFSSTVGSSNGGFYVIFRVPAGSQAQADGAGGGPALGYTVAAEGYPGWMSADGEDWSPVHPDYGFAVRPILVEGGSAMMIKSGRAAGGMKDPATGEQSPSPALPTVTVLRPAMPNPFNPQTTLRFSLKGVADTAYGSAENAVSAECLGTELISPTSGSRAQEEGDLTDERRALTTADFNLDVGLQRATVCPAGHASITYIELSFAPDRVAIVFDQDRCEACPHYKRCPARLDDSAGGYVLTVNLVTDNLARRRRREASGEFAKRYAIRAGIEATNSELKRKHGLGKLPVRSRLRVVLAVCLKALACNLKRMVRAIRMAAAAGVPTGGQDGDLLAQRKPRLRRSGVTTRIFGGLTSSWLWPRYFGLGGGIAVVTVKRG